MKTRICIFFIHFLLFSASLFSQQDEYCIDGRFSESPYFSLSQLRYDTGMIYGYAKNFSTGNTEALKMDIFYPSFTDDSLTARPFILMVHGGGFLLGSRQTLTYYCEEFARRGFVCATIDYRMGWNCPNTTGNSITDSCGADSSLLRDATYEAAQDVRAAMRYVSENKFYWGVDPDHFFVGGPSAGSIAAVCASAWTQEDANAFAPDAENILGALDTSGNQFAGKYSVRGVIDNCGAIPGDTSLLSMMKIPMISFHDEFDCVVPIYSGNIFGCWGNVFYTIYGSSAMHNSITRNGGCSELNIINGSGNHCGYPDSLIVQRSSCFFKRIMCNSCYSYTNAVVGRIDSCANAPYVSIFDQQPVSMTAAINHDDLKISFGGFTPMNGKLFFTNELGQEMGSVIIPAHSREVLLRTENFPAGIYFVSFDTSGEIVPLKVLITH
ncbi:MAG: carboxylesterase family protein [Bacteroidetes bacterium]|nr:carboxylesterase family protein [Bacteroidota bacterium]